MLILLLFFTESYCCSTICSTISVVLVTSVMPTSPNVTLIDAVYSHLRGISCLERAPFIIGLHLNPTKDLQIRMQYEENLRTWIQHSTSNTSLLVSAFSNAEAAFLRAISKVKTKYFLFWEHDWMYCRQIPIRSVLLEMERTNGPVVNYVKFNKQMNVPHAPPRFDVLMAPCRYCEYVPLLFTPSWSNNPHIARTQFFMQRCAPLLDNNESAPTVNGFMEKAITKAIWRQLAARGVDETERAWGTYVYGHMESGRVLQHINGAYLKGAMRRFLLCDATRYGAMWNVLTQLITNESILNY